MKPEIKAIIKNQFIECTVTRAPEDGIISALPVSDKDDKLVTNETISPAYPIVKLSKNNLKKGDKVIVFSAKGQVRKYYYIPINLIIPFIEKEIIISEKNRISSNGFGILNIINGDNTIRLNTGNYSDDTTFGNQSLITGVLNKSYPENTTKIYIKELKKDIDYQRKIILINFSLKQEVFLNEEDSKIQIPSEAKRIKSFNFVSEGSNENYILLEKPFDTSLDSNKFKIEYEIFTETITQVGKEKTLEIISDEGLGLFLDAVKEGYSKIRLETPSNKIELQEGQYTEGNGEAVRLGKSHFKVSSNNYKQNYVKDYDNKRPYEFNIINYDYIDPSLETDSRIRSQKLELKTIKHRLTFLDTEGVGDVYGSNKIKNEYIEYSSIGGNYIKFGSEKDTESSLTYKTKTGIKITQTNSSISTEQYNNFDVNTLEPVYKDPTDPEASPTPGKPINKFVMERILGAEKISLESHSGDIENYDTLVNIFQLSETADSATIKISNKGKEDKYNEVKMSTSDGSLTITNTFASGKTNTIKMTTDTISIGNAENKVKITITADGMTIEAEGPVGIKGKEVTVEGDVTFTGGSLTTKGTVAPDPSATCFNALSNCIFAGVVHGGPKVSGT